MTKSVAGRDGTKTDEPTTSGQAPTDPDAASDAEHVERAPELIGPTSFSARDKCQVYPAAVYLGQRIQVGDHVLVNTGGPKHWVSVIEALFHCTSRGAPAFRGRWFWAPEDVRAYQEKSGKGMPMRPSRAEANELICSDNRDTNLVEVIAGRAHVLSWSNFQRVRARVNRARARWRAIFFCDRIYYHKAFVLRDLSNVLFPGDPIPPELLAELSLCPDDVGRASDCMRKTPYIIGGSSTTSPSVDEDDPEVVEIDTVASSEQDKPLDPHAVFIV